jgi:hypothetical protein
MSKLEHPIFRNSLVWYKSRIDNSLNIHESHIKEYYTSFKTEHTNNLCLLV